MKKEEKIVKLHILKPYTDKEIIHEKIIKLTIFVCIFLFWLFSKDIELWSKGRCILKHSDSYLDYMVCNNKVLNDSGYLYHFYVNDILFIVYMKIYFDYPNICYSDERKIYIYNYKVGVGIDISEKEFKSKYSIQLENIPDSYVLKYQNNCL